MGRWESVGNHPNLVGLREAFASDEWDGSASLLFVHDYHPGRWWDGGLYRVADGMEGSLGQAQGVGAE